MLCYHVHSKTLEGRNYCRSPRTTFLTCGDSASCLADEASAEVEKSACGGACETSATL